MYSVENRVMDAESLKDSAVLILSNLDKIHSTDSIDEIISLIDHSPVATYKMIFEGVVDFHKANGRFPDANYIESKYAHKYYKVEFPYSTDVLLDFTNQLRKHKKLKDISNALDDFDLEKVTDIVNRDLKVDNIGVDVGIDNIEEIYDKIERSPNGMMLGIPQLDYYIGGMDYGTLNVIAAPVSSFKTTIAISTAYHACFNEGKNVIYLTLEVTPSKVMFDLIARHAYEMGYNIPASSLKKGKLTPEEKEIFKEVKRDWKLKCKGNIKIIGTENIREYTPTYLEAYIQKKKEEMGGLDMLYIDYLNLFKNKIPPSMKLDQYAALNFYTQFFTDMSIRLHYILIMLCQVNRAGTEKLDTQASKDGGKKLASTTVFAEANEVERSASVALILHATRAMKNSGNVDIFLVKNRDGACPEEPITCPVKPEYFLVGTKEFSELNSTQSMMNDCACNPEFADDDLDISGLVNDDSGIDVESMEDILNEDKES